ncbi:MAG: response regulator, partial [Pseudomonadota bacterium]|nr:response regulator [Pseudomonadota bacterium]
MMHQDEIILFDEAEPADVAPTKKLLIVDDEPDVHKITELALADVVYKGHGLKFLTARSAAEARAVLREHPDVAVVLLDVVMETDTAGLDFIRHVRDEIGNRKIRIILRTGQPGAAPERQVILNYDIHDYKAKSELTAQRLFTSVIGALRTYEDLEQVERIAAEKAGAEAKLARVEEYLREAIEAIPHGLLLFGRDRRLVVRNGRLAAIDPGLAERMTIGAPCAVFTDWYAGLAARENAADEPKGGELDREVELEDGRWLRIQSECTAQDDLLVLVSEVTNTKAVDAEVQRQREAMHQSEKLTALGSLLAGVAHELNNPLSIVVARAALLKDSAIDAKTAAQARSIGAAADRCARIVKTFLALARQRPPERRAVDLNTIVHEGVELLGYGLRSTGVRVTLDLAENLPELWADPDQLSQAVLNLIVNAQHALSERAEPRKLELSTEHDQTLDLIRIRVADNGPGIPRHMRHRVFEPFFTTKPIGSGTGLGLSVSLGNIQAHGGQLEFEDTPGGGATFIVTLPVTRPQEQADAPAPQPDRVAERRILVVDDEPEIAELLRDILRREGHRVALARSGREALDQLDGGRFDLVISDLMMPELDGVGLYRELRQREGDRAAPMIFITGDSLRSVASEAVVETGCPVIEKP